MKTLKFIADVNIEKPLIAFLLGTAYDIKWIPDYNCELTDHELLKMANAEKRILLTNDKDFGELIFLQGKVSSGIVLFRVKGQSVDRKVELLGNLLRDHADKLFKNFVIITEKKVRVIPLENIK